MLLYPTRHDEKRKQSDSRDKRRVLIVQVGWAWSLIIDEIKYTAVAF